MTVMEMTQKELTEAIAAGLSSVVNRIDSRVNALVSRLDVLEKRTGLAFDTMWPSPFCQNTVSRGGSDSDTKDALIRDLYDAYTATPGPGSAGFRDRAEKLGVKL